MHEKPRHLDLRRDEALEIVWADGTTSTYPIAWLRKMSPSADAKTLREEQARNPLTVLPATTFTDAPIRAVDAELVGNYALRITFSDGHSTGIYSWAYLRTIDPDRPAAVDPASAPTRRDGPDA